MATRSRQPLGRLRPPEPETTTERSDEETTERCPECDGSPRPAGIETVCADCGLVLDENPIDHGPEWRGSSVDTMLNPGDDPRRTGPPRNLTLHDHGLGSRIGENEALPYRQRRANKRARQGGGTERNRMYAFGEVHRMADALDLPGVARETACQLIKQAQDVDLVTGLSLEGIATASLIASARIHGHDLTFADAQTVTRHSEAFGMPKLSTCYSKLIDELGVPVPPPDPAALVGGICRELGLPASVQTDAEETIRDTDEMAIQGRHPSGIAAGAVFLASGGGPTKIALADAAGVTPPTLRAAMEVLEDG